MLHSEFENLVGMQVSPEEYTAIEKVYMAADIDKTEFCYYWRKMNANRIRIYKEKLKEQEKKSRIAETLWTIITKCRVKKSHLDLAFKCLTKKEKATLSECGIDHVYNVYGTYKNMLDIVTDIKKILK